MHPLVQVQCNRIGPLDSGQQRPDRVRQHGYSADSAIDMKPGIEFQAEICNRIQVIDCTRVDGSRGCYNADGLISGLHILDDLALQLLQVDRVIIVDFNFT